jgi:hypothetical protein
MCVTSEPVRSATAKAGMARGAPDPAPHNGAVLMDPDAGRVLFGNYAADWIEERPGLRPKTTELHRYLPRSHLSPTFDARPLAEIWDLMCGAGGRISCTPR